MRGASPESASGRATAKRFVVNGYAWREGRWQPNRVEGSSIDSFSQAVIELGQLVLKRRKDLRDARCKLGAMLLGVRDQFKHGEWMTWLNTLPVNEKTLRAALKIAEHLCDENGVILPAKVSEAKMKRPYVRVSDEIDSITLSQAERLVGHRAGDDITSDELTASATDRHFSRLHQTAKHTAAARDVKMPAWTASSRLASEAAAAPEPAAIGAQMTLEELRVATRAKCVALESKINELSADQLARLLTALADVA